MPPTQVVKQCQVIHTRLHSITSGTHIGGIFQHSGKLLETPDTPATGRVDQLATEIAKIFLLVNINIYSLARLEIRCKYQTVCPESHTC